MIHYMWNFKPNEKNKLSPKLIQHNQKYIDQFDIYNPEKLNIMLEEECAFDIFPNLKDLLPLIPKWIILADLGRLLIVYFKGGFYCDIDCFIKKEIPISTSKICVFEEKIVPHLNFLGQRERKDHDKYRQRIANYFFGSTSIRHEFLKLTIDECLSRLQIIINEQKQANTISNHDVLWCCGPDVMTSIYHENDKTNIELYDQSFLHHVCLSSWRTE